MTLPFHPLSEIFPLLEGEEFADMVADIKANGLQQPIVTYEGKILEGRNRFRACLEAGINPDLIPYQGTDPAKFVFSANIVRRHLTTSQRGIFAAELARRKHGGDQATNSALGIPTIKQAANLAHVSEQTVRVGKIVIANGTPEEIAEVKTGKTTIYRVIDAIRERKKARVVQAARTDGKVPARNSLKVPDGYDSLTAAIAPGIESERAGTPSRRAAKETAFSLNTYVALRDVVLLSKRTDLSKRDSKTVHDALAEINKTRRVAHAQELVKPISLKVWGRNGNRFKSDKTRVAEFTDSIMFVVTGCTSVADVELPALEKKIRADIDKDISGAIAALTYLRRRLRKEDG